MTSRFNPKPNVVYKRSWRGKILSKQHSEMEFSKFYTKLGWGIFNRHSGEISSGIDKIP
jgi:hypothetical protein